MKITQKVFPAAVDRHRRDHQWPGRAHIRTSAGEALLRAAGLRNVRFPTCARDIRAWPPSSSPWVPQAPAAGAASAASSLLSPAVGEVVRSPR